MKSIIKNFFYYKRKMYRVDENGKRVEVENMSFGGNGNNSSEIKEGFMDMEEDKPYMKQKWVIVLLSLVALGLVGGGVWWYMNKKKNNDNSVNQTFGFRFY